jgi:hypothetical protein
VLGCAVSVIIQIGSFVSNSAEIPIAANGRTCGPTSPDLSPADLQRLLSLGNTLTTDALVLRHSTVKQSSGQILTIDDGVAAFARRTAPYNLLVDSRDISSRMKKKKFV